MKHKVFLAGMSAALLALGMTVVGCDKKPVVGNRANLIIVNKIGNPISKVIVCPSSSVNTGNNLAEGQTIEKGGSVTVKVPKNADYLITLVDNKNHFYGIEGYHVGSEDACHAEITNKNFLPQGVLDTIKKLFGL